ncbi:MAG: CDP-diacylglycerol--serine O-phosphatidyltransferase [Proteobacteria bacterium]|nr:CDP-diacylglycerol--serine O-phosphatidyltransferase [Pseudomonadota bacterium]
MNNFDKKYQKDSIKKGVYILPNLLTSASLMSGFYAIVSVWNENFVYAAYAIIISAIFDMLDGRIARMMGAASRFGVEYDSLADLVAFGVAPSLLIYAWALRPYGRIGWMAGFLYLICGALRLARFNVQINTVESRKFNGLPIPGAALVISSAVIFYYELAGEGQTLKEYFVLLLTFALAFLMISTIKYHSFKDLDPIKRKPFSALTFAILVFILIIAKHEVFLFLIFFAYSMSGPVFYLIEKRKKVRS